MATKPITEIIEGVASFPVLFCYVMYDKEDPNFSKKTAKIRSWFGELGHRDIQVNVQHMYEDGYRIVAYPPDLQDEVVKIL